MTHWTDPRHDGAGTWEHTASHGLRLTLLGTVVLCLVCAGLFLAVLKVGRAVVCHVNHQQVRYCAGYTPTEPAR